MLKTVNPSNPPYLSKLPARSAQIQICMLYMAGMLMRPRCHSVSSPVRFSSVSIDPNPHTPRTGSQCLPTAVLHGRSLPAPRCVSTRVAFGLASTYHRHTEASLSLGDSILRTQGLNSWFYWRLLHFSLHLQAPLCSVQLLCFFFF